LLSGLYVEWRCDGGVQSKRHNGETQCVLHTVRDAIQSRYLRADLRSDADN
jgi:hypothetical protein